MGRPRLEQKVERTLRTFRMLDSGDAIVVAVSGGADSVALLHCLLSLAPAQNLSLRIAHLNHDLRGDESKADEEFVRSLSERLGLPFDSETARLQGPGNLEARARRARYSFLRRVAAGNGAQKIALGHTLDDQAETVLLRLLRGSGLQGLSAIRPVLEGWIIRPLLDCSRPEILDYLRERGAAWREDSSNLDLTFRRNRVRHQLLPYLAEHFNRRIRRTLATEARIARVAASYIDESVSDLLAVIADRSRAETAIPVDELARLHPAPREWLIRRAFAAASGCAASLTSAQVERVLDLCEPGKSGRRTQLPGGFAARREFDRLLIGHPAMEKGDAGVAPTTPPYRLSLAVPGRCGIPEARLSISAAVVSARPSAAGNTFRAVLDADRVPRELEVRTRQPGDHYGGPSHAKLKKILIDRKVPLSRRDNLPVVASGCTVIWAPGLPAPRSLSPGPSTTRWLVLEAIPDDTVTP